MIVLPLAAEIYYFILAFVLGACIGSFVNCAADRYVAKESVLRGRSHCPACGHVLGFFELVPIFSYLFLGGKCRHCGAKIPMRCFGVELLGGTVYASIAYFSGLSFEALEYAVLFPALLAVALIDLDTMEIPDGLLLFGAVLFLAFLPLHKDAFLRAEAGFYGAVAIGGGILAVSLLLDLVLHKETLGGGDVKLFAMLGLYTGIWRGLLLLILACILGLLFLLFGGRNKKKEFPFGPAIALAAAITLLTGQGIIDWYLSLML